MADHQDIKQMVKDRYGKAALAVATGEELVLRRQRLLRQ